MMPRRGLASTLSEITPNTRSSISHPNHDLFEECFPSRFVYGRITKCTATRSSSKQHTLTSTSENKASEGKRANPYRGGGSPPRRGALPSPPSQSSSSVYISGRYCGPAACHEAVGDGPRFGTPQCIFHHRKVLKRPGLERQGYYDWRFESSILHQPFALALS